MDFADELALPAAPARAWAALVDFRRVAACLPGCERVEEVEPLARYRAVMAQRLGPFRVEVPMEITIEEVREPERLRARAAGRDRVTGTLIDAGVTLTLAPDPGGGTRLSLETSLQVGGRLATLGYPAIRARAAESVAEFGRRLAAALAEA